MEINCWFSNHKQYDLYDSIYNSKKSIPSPTVDEYMPTCISLNRVFWQCGINCNSIIKKIRVNHN